MYLCVYTDLDETVVFLKMVALTPFLYSSSLGPGPEMGGLPASHLSFLVLAQFAGLAGLQLQRELASLHEERAELRTLTVAPGSWQAQSDGGDPREPVPDKQEISGKGSKKENKGIGPVRKLVEPWSKTSWVFSAHLIPFGDLCNSFG